MLVSQICVSLAQETVIYLIPSCFIEIFCYSEYAIAVVIYGYDTNRWFSSSNKYSNEYWILFMFTSNWLLLTNALYSVYHTCYIDMHPNPQSDE